MDIYQCVVSCFAIICLTVVVISHIERKKPRANHGITDSSRAVQADFIRYIEN